MDLSSIGERVYGFALWYSIIITVIAISFASAGYTLDSPLFVPSSTFYKSVNNIANNLPRNATLSQLLLKGGSLLAGSVLQFTFTLLFGLIALIQTITYIIPPQLSFLVPSLYFLGGFFQFVVWYYIISKIISTLSNIV